MIAIVTGLFLGAGSRLREAGPGLFIVDAICGVFVSFILRALGGLVLHRPSSGSFVSHCCCRTPTTRLGESPFVTFFAAIGMSAAGGITNMVVLTVVLSSLIAGLYSTGRTLRSMAMNGSAPQFTGKMNRNGVPFCGIALTGLLTLPGILLNLVVPEEAFNIALDLSALGIISTWGMIVLCQIQLYRWEKKGILERPAFRRGHRGPATRRCSSSRP